MPVVMSVDIKCEYACYANVHVVLVRETARQLGASLMGKLIRVRHVRRGKDAASL